MKKTILAEISAWILLILAVLFYLPWFIAGFISHIIASCFKVGWDYAEYYGVFMLKLSGWINKNRIHNEKSKAKNQGV